MDSKRQSKLPEGLGKKIIQALKTQDVPNQPTQAPGGQPPQEMYSEPQAGPPPGEDHGLETISHMDFGSQEMQYDQGQGPQGHPQYIPEESPGPLEATEFQAEMDSGPLEPMEFVADSSSEFADLENLPGAGDTPQYGSFAPMEDELPEPDYNQQSYDDMSYNQQTYEQQIPEDFDYNQQSYGDFGQGYEQQAAPPEEIPAYQQPQLGMPDEEIPDYQQPQLGPGPGEGYELAPQQPQMEEVPPPQYDSFQPEMTEYQPYDDQGYTEYAPPGAPAPPEQDFDHYNYESDYPQEAPGTQYEPETYQQQAPQEGPDNYGQQDIQIGYSQQAMHDSYEQEPESQWAEAEPPRTIDLDAVQPVAEPHYAQPQQPVKSPLDLDKYDAQDYKIDAGREPQHASPPVKPGPQLDDYSYDEPQEVHRQEERTYQEPVREPLRQEERPYQEPARDPLRIEERPYQEPARDPYRPDERPYQEPARDPYRPEERHYHEPVRDPYRPEERHYHEPARDPYRPEERHYHEPARDPYRPEDRRYHEPLRDPYRSEERRYHEPARDPYRPEERRYHEPYREDDRMRRDEKPPTRRVEMFNSNVETLIKLVTTLPPGVTRQTGAQIIRQTMEAMGISMTDVLADAQTAQARLQKYMKDNFNRIEEYKLLIRQLDDDIHYYQGKSKELDDLISLFILSEQDRRGH